MSLNPTAPIVLNFAMNIMFNNEQCVERLGEAHWNSPAGKATREYLKCNGLVRMDYLYKDVGGQICITQKYHITDKGRAWIKHCCSTPLPVEKSTWVPAVEMKEWVRG